MVEIGERNPPLPPNSSELQKPPLDRSSMEEKPNNRSVLPPNFVSLRQLRERHLKEEQEKEKEMEKARESDGGGRFPPNYAPLRPLKEWNLQEEKEKEEETDHCARVAPNYVSLRHLKEEQEKTKGKGREEESETRLLLPPNYVSLRQLREQRLREQKEKENENEKEKEEEIVKRKMKEKENEEEEEKGESYSLLPPNYVSLRLIKELRLQEKEEKDAEGEAQKPRVRQIIEREKGDESRRTEVEINEKASNRVRNLQSKKPDKLGCMNTRWAWQPVLPPADASTNSGISSANSVFQSENAGVSHEVMMVSFDQNGHSEMKPKNKSNKKKGKKKQHKENHSRKIISGKNKGGPVEGPELPIEVMDPKRGGISAPEVALSLNEYDTVKRGKEEKVNLTKSSGQSIPVCVEMKRFNGTPSMRSKKHNRRDEGKGKEVNLSEPSYNVDPVSKVAKGADGLEEVVGSKIKNGNDRKGKGKMVTIPQSSDQAPSHEEAKGAHGAGEVIGSEIVGGEEKGRGKNVNQPESSELEDQVGGNWMKRNQAAGFRSMGQRRAGRFTMRSAEQPRRGGGLVWMPKKSF